MTKSEKILNLSGIFKRNGAEVLNYGEEFNKYFGVKPLNSLSQKRGFKKDGICADILRALTTDKWQDVFTPKQKKTVELMHSGGFKRLNILEGSVRSGKTHISLVLWGLAVNNADADAQFLMCGKTLKTLKRNCLQPLKRIFGSANVDYSLSKKEAHLFGRLIYLEGAGNSESEEKIRGMTLCGAYCDEITLCDEDFFAMLLSRLSMPGAFMLGTTNPDNPTHWFKEKYLDRADELDLLSIQYLIDDNTFLEQSYIQAIKREYVGVYYQRFILGEWVAAEGAVYPLFADEPEKFIVHTINKDDVKAVSIGVDFGGNGSAHAFVANAIMRGFKRLVTVDEFYLKKEISPSELEGNFVEFVRRVQEDYPVYEVYADSAESTLIKGLRKAAAKNNLGVAVNKARKGAITERIRFYNTMMSRGRYAVLDRCPMLIKAFKNAVWERKNTGGKDVRLDNGKLNIDSLDALEYSTESYADVFLDMN